MARESGGEGRGGGWRSKVKTEKVKRERKCKDSAAAFSGFDQLSVKRILYDFFLIDWRTNSSHMVEEYR